MKTVVKYLGNKPRVPVYRPVGKKPTAPMLKDPLWADPFIELEHEEAHALVELDPVSFAIHSDPECDGTEIHENGLTLEGELPKKRRGRPPKSA